MAQEKGRTPNEIGLSLDFNNKSAMNNKTVFLSSLKSFDEITGQYTMQCVCGEVIAIYPSQLLQLRVKIPCTACYLKYDLQLSGKMNRVGCLIGRIRYRDCILLLA